MSKNKLIRKIFSDWDESQKDGLTEKIEELKDSGESTIQYDDIKISKTDNENKFVVEECSTGESCQVEDDGDEMQFSELEPEVETIESAEEVVPVEKESTDTTKIVNEDGTITETTIISKTYSKDNYNKLRKFSDDEPIESFEWNSGDTVQFMMGTTMCFGVISEVEDGKAEIEVDSSCGVDISEVKISTDKLMKKVDTSFSDIPMYDEKEYSYYIVYNDDDNKVLGLETINKADETSTISEVIAEFRNDGYTNVVKFDTIKEAEAEIKYRLDNSKKGFKVEKGYSDIPSDEKTAEELGTPNDMLPEVIDQQILAVKVDTEETAMDPEMPTPTIEDVVDMPELDPEDQTDIAGVKAMSEDDNTEDYTEKVGSSIDKNLEGMNSSEPATIMIDQTNEDENVEVPLLDPDAIEVEEEEKVFSNRSSLGTIDRLLMDQRTK